MRTYLKKEKKRKETVNQKTLYPRQKKVAIKTLGKLSIIQMTSSIIQKTLSNQEQQQSAKPQRPLVAKMGSIQSKVKAVLPHY